MGTSIEISKHRERWPNLSGSSSIDMWRQAKAIADKISDEAEKDMTDAFGCHGEPIANAISDLVWRMYELVPATKEREVRSLLLTGFQSICNEMTDVRSQLDRLIDKMANDQRREGWDEAINQMPDGDDVNASDYGLDLANSLEDAFEAGVNAISGYLDNMYPESVTVTMDDL